MKIVLARTAAAVMMFAFSLSVASKSCCAQDPYAPIEKVLQDEGYLPHFPLSDTIHPGGLAKLCGRSKTYDFIPLAQGAKIAETSSALFQWAAATSDKKTTVSLLLNAISSMLAGVNITATVGGEQTLNLNQISATGIILKYDPVSVLQDDPVLRQEVRNYQSNCSVFLVTEVATTNAISFTTDKAIEASIQDHDPSAVNSCVLPPAAAPAAATAAPAAGSSSVSAAAPTTTSAHLEACLTSANQITLNSPNALVFAVKVEALNKMPPEPAAAAAAPPAAPGNTNVAALSCVASNTCLPPDLATLVSQHNAPVKGKNITGMANPTAPTNILNLQFRQANSVVQ